jgi:CubicO group peptidase (beta-lactamase class C family)
MHLVMETMPIDDPCMGKVNALMRAGVARGIFPGAVLLVGLNGRVRHHQAYGFADLFNRKRVSCNTYFDLASLTKPLATALAVMQLFQQGDVDLDRPLIESLPGLLGSDKRQVTTRHLLSHCSGLPPMRPYYLRLCHFPHSVRIDVLKRWVRGEPLLFAPGTKEDYSDLGYMLLQWLVEEKSGLSLDRFLEQKIYQTQDPATPFFVDLNRVNQRTGDYAATELCPWRGRLLKGQVHDDNAYAMGGIGGHAGLFSNALAVFQLLQTLLDIEDGKNRQSIFGQTCIQTFFQCQHHGRFALGFDTPSVEGSSAGRFFSPDSVGHLGFAGTSFWMDRRKKVIVILLTNRVHPSRFNPGIKAFRPLLHDAVMQALHMDQSK